jgi:hypothetical protein
VSLQSFGIAQQLQNECTSAKKHTRAFKLLAHSQQPEVDEVQERVCQQSREPVERKVPGYVRIHQRDSTSAHAYTHTSKYTQNTCRHICQTYMHACMHTYIHTCSQNDRHTNTHTCVHTEEEGLWGNQEPRRKRLLQERRFDCSQCA